MDATSPRQSWLQLRYGKHKLTPSVRVFLNSSSFVESVPIVPVQRGHLHRTWVLESFDSYFHLGLNWKDYNSVASNRRKTVCAISCSWSLPLPSLFNRNVDMKAGASKSPWVWTWSFNSRGSHTSIVRSPTAFLKLFLSSEMSSGWFLQASSTNIPALSAKGPDGLDLSSVSRNTKTSS